MPSHDPQLLKGVLAPLLLALLAERESYGYDLVQRVRALGLTDVAEGTIYPALTRLELQGRLAGRLAPSSSGPARKYYRPTPAGLAALADSAASWRDFTSIVDPVLAAVTPCASVKEN